MYCKDFEYDGEKLSDYGYILCHILTDSNVEAISIGSNITFNTIKLATNNKFGLLSTQYDKAYTTTFEICKHDCKNENDKYFTQEEVSHIMRWLNRKLYRRFKVIYDDGTLANVYYNASFNVESIRLNGEIIGFELTLVTDAPFGYYDEVEYVMEFTEDNLSYSYFDISDEIGYIYPSTMTIEMTSTGDFEMVNSQETDRVTKIKNCISGEVITLTSDINIDSSAVHNKLYNDFNYVYPRICNKHEDIYNYGFPIDDMENTFTVNIPCKVTFTYSPICKMGII